ncbi:hypothetical protein BKA70DRAFT_1436076 [Coprinopsis sp. MPI-PUGE-AT-0042]|nr:hypothetical protein BKA70DRAFT_1436076 [Coprinopsis sp. MPI-PUGE-AT-0042]
MTEPEANVQGDLVSCTAEVGQYDHLHESGIEVCIVDTPGFNANYRAEVSTGKSDLKILQMIHAFLKEEGSLESSSCTTSTLAPLDWQTQRRTISLFKKLCGTESMKNVVVVTSFWDSFDGVANGIPIESDLRTKDRILKELHIGKQPDDPTFLTPKEVVDYLLNFDLVETQKEKPLENSGLLRQALGTIFSLHAVMGSAVSGKSSGRAEAIIADGPEAPRGNVEQYIHLHESGMEVRIVDTPGFNDSRDGPIGSDLKILQTIGAFLKNKSFAVLNPWKNVVVVTSFWDELLDKTYGIQREVELQTEDGLLKELYAGGAKFVRSPIPKAVDYLLSLDPAYVEKQKVMAMGKTTAAGSSLLVESEKFKREAQPLPERVTLRMKKPAVICGFKYLGTLSAKSPLLNDIRTTEKITEPVTENGVEVHTIRLEDGSTALIVNLPAYDESVEKDADVNETLRSFFRHHETRVCHAVILAYDLSKFRLRCIDLLNFALIAKLCGPSFSKNLAIVTTNWHQNPEDRHHFEARETDLKTNKCFCGGFLEDGARYYAHKDVPTSKIITDLASQPPMLLAIQVKTDKQNLEEKTAMEGHERRLNEQ